MALLSGVESRLAINILLAVARSRGHGRGNPGLCALGHPHSLANSYRLGVLIGTRATFARG